jgi:hypothetical protein
MKPYRDTRIVVRLPFRLPLATPEAEETPPGMFFDVAFNDFSA